MRLIVTNETAATVWHRVANATARVRRKYEGAITVARVLNRREAPLLAMGSNGVYGLVGEIKFQWGFGGPGPWCDWVAQGWINGRGFVSPPLHDLGDVRRWARGLSDMPGVTVYPWSSTESRKVLNGGPR